MRGKDNVKNKKLLQEILLDYGYYIHRFKAYIVCNFLTYRCLCLKTFEWSDCSPSTIQKFEEKINVNIKDNKYGYYGIIDKKKVFKIMDIEKSKLIISDKRKKARGLACTSWQKNDIIVMSVKIGITFESKLIQPYVQEAVHEFVLNGLLSCLGMSTEKEIKKVNPKVLASAVYLLKENKKNACQVLQDWFVRKGIVVYE